MSEFLASLKSDLLDRRFLPMLALLGVALAAALAYTVLGGGSSTSPPRPAGSASSGVVPATGAVAITQAPAADQAVSETTSGAHHQSGTPRNPFAPLPGAKKQAASSAGSTSASKGSSASKTSSSGSGKSTPSAGGTAPAATLKPIAPPKRVFIRFHTTVQFGVVPAVVAGAPPQPAQLKTYADMALDEPLPSKANPQLLYLGVVLKTGKDAVFALTGGAILHGSAVCKPSPTQCQAIELQIGQSETLEVVEANGQAATYELKLLSISKSVNNASGAGAHAASTMTSKAGRRLLGRDGVPTLSELSYLPRQGGLVSIWHSHFGAHRAFAAHASARRR